MKDSPQCAVHCTWQEWVGQRVCLEKLPWLLASCEYLDVP